MTEEVGEAVVRIRQDESGFDPAGAGKRAGKGYASGFGSSIKGLAGGIAATLAVGKGISFLKDSVGEAREGQKVAAATTATIKATGGAAKVTAAQVGDLAGAISAKTGIDDEAIQSGSNLLLTFKNVANAGKGQAAIFDRATESAVNLSAAGFGSVTGASVMLGKALNDPVKGVSALGRAGVTFTQAQKDQIKAMQESGDLLGAQKIILGEVEGQVGGVAEATATAGEKASVAWGNIKESVGGLLLPVLDRLGNIFVDTIAPGIQTVINGAGRLGPVFSAIGDTIGKVFDGGAVSGIGDSLRDTFAALGPLGGQVVAQLRPLLSTLGTGLRTAITSLLPVAQSMAQTFRVSVLPALIGIGRYVVANVIPIVTRLAGVFLTQVVPAVAQVARFVYGTLYPALIRIVTAVAQNLRPVLDTLIQVFVTRILPTFEKVVKQVRTQLIPALQPLIVKVVAITGFLLRLASAILGRVLPPLLRLAGFIISRLVPVIVTVITWVAKFANGLLNLVGAVGRGIGAVGRFAGELVGRVAGAVRTVVGAITGLPGKIMALGGRMAGAGRSIIGAFVNGLKNAGGIISGIAGNVWDALRGLLNGAIDRINNALEFGIKIGPKSFTINPPDIGHLATGTPSWRGGWAEVGEEGPELVNLPRGARVYTAAQTERMKAAGQTTAGPVDRSVHIQVTNHYPKPERPSDAVRRMRNLTYALGVTG